MKCHVLKKRAITLIEIMIVMFLIALIAGVVTYNYRGSLDEGKSFKTSSAIDRVETILNLSVSDEPELLDNLQGNWKNIIRSSPLVKNPNDLIYDGWGNEFKVDVDPNGNIKVSSDKYNDYKKSNATMFKK